MKIRIYALVIMLFTSLSFSQNARACNPGGGGSNDPVYSTITITIEGAVETPFWSCIQNPNDPVYDDLGLVGSFRNFNKLFTVPYDYESYTTGGYTAKFWMKMFYGGSTDCLDDHRHSYWTSILNGDAKQKQLNVKNGLFMQLDMYTECSSCTNAGVNGLGDWWLQGRFFTEMELVNPGDIRFDYSNGHQPPPSCNTLLDYGCGSNETD